MADSSAQAEIRGIDIDKLAKGFADEDIVFKRFVTNSSTKAREIRWYQKTSGFLQLSSAAYPRIENVSALARPFTLEQSWDRQTSYVRKYFIESPLISSEDIKDSDIDVLATNVRDLTRAVSYKVDARIWDVVSEGLPSAASATINLVNCSGGKWGAATNLDPIDDLLDAKKKIRQAGYNPEGGSLIINSESHKELLRYLITTKGSSIPAFASQKVVSGVVMEIVGLNLSVSENVTSKYGIIGNLARACTWKQFMPITARTIEEVGIGTKIRVWEEGEALLTDPKAVCLLSGCGTNAIT